MRFRLFGTLITVLLLTMLFTSAANAEEGTSTPESVTVVLGNNLDNTGKFTSNVTISTEENGASVAFEKGNSVTPSAYTLTEISIIPDINPSHLTPDFSICSTVYDIKPHEVTFNENVTVTLAYNSDLITSGVTPFVAWFNSMTGGWDSLDTFYIDKINNTISVKVKRFSIFGVFIKKETTATTATLTEAASPNEVSIPSTVPAKETPGPVGPSNNWPLIGGIIAAILVVGVLILAFAPRKR